LVPFGLNTRDFQPRNQAKCRTKHNLHGDSPLILFGADRIDSPMKGMDWLIHALKILNGQGVKFRLASFGRGDVGGLLPASIEQISLGSISNPTELGELYCCADLMAVPSRLESFGQTASEAQACGVPVVCFDSSGLRDIVSHRTTGYRATCFQAEDLANGIRWCIEDPERLEEMRRKASDSAAHKFAIAKVASSYNDLYKDTLNQWNSQAGG
jgi:glycosyltransferase involved in cell wall biosynthesis